MGFLDWFFGSQAGMIADAATGSRFEPDEVTGGFGSAKHRAAPRLVTQADEQRMMRAQPANKSAKTVADNLNGGTIPSPQQYTPEEYAAAHANDTYSDPYAASVESALSDLSSVQVPQYDVKLDLSDIDKAYGSSKAALNNALKAALGNVESARKRTKGTVNASIGDTKANYKAAQNSVYADAKNASQTSRKGADTSRVGDYKNQMASLASQKAANIKDALAVAQQSGGNGQAAVDEINKQYNAAVADLEGRYSDRSNLDNRNADAMLEDASANSMAVAADGAQANADLNALLVQAMNSYDTQRMGLENQNGQDQAQLNLQRLQQILSAKESYRDKKWQADTQNATAKQNAMMQALQGAQALRSSDLEAWNRTQAATASANAKSKEDAARAQQAMAKLSAETQQKLAIEAAKGDAALKRALIQQSGGDPAKLSALMQAYGLSQ